MFFLPKLQHHHPKITAGTPTMARTTVTVKKNADQHTYDPKQLQLLRGRKQFIPLGVKNIGIMRSSSLHRSYDTLYVHLCKGVSGPCWHQAHVRSSLAILDRPWTGSCFGINSLSTLRLG